MGHTSSEVDSSLSKRQLCGGSQAAIERMIHFGRELQSMSEHLRRECGKNSANKKMLKVCWRPSRPMHANVSHITLGFVVPMTV